LSLIIETRKLTKKFGNIVAVDELSFGIQQGDIYGFLGQNGAGKSTTMRMLLGLIYPTSGEVFINGKSFSNSRRYLLQHIGAIIERPDMYGYLSGWDNLRIIAKLSKKSITKARLYEVLEITGLRGRENDLIKAYSQGMKQRLGIAIALVHDPELLILDEPTNGLDPQGIADVRNLVKQLSADHGKTILISSHLLHEIEQVATSMLIIHKGKKIAEGKVRELLNPNETLMEVSIQPSKEISARLHSSDWAKYIYKINEVNMVFKMNPDQMPVLNEWLVTNGFKVLEIRSKHSLEAYFLTLTNDEAAANRTI